MAQWKVVAGDCIEVMRDLPDNSFDSIVTDPPAGIGFMGVSWDTYGDGKGGGRTDDDWDHAGSKERARTADQQQRVTAKQGRAFRAQMTLIFGECLRVLKPGGHALVWALPRTSHWTATALEDAGFEVRDCLNHVFGSGFPKSQDVSKVLSGNGTICACKIEEDGWKEAEARPNMSDLRSSIPTEESEGTGASAVLLPSLLRPVEGAGPEGADSHGLHSQELPRQNAALEVYAYGAEPSVEGRGYLQTQQGELHRPEVCSLSSQVAPDGAEGRLCDGAPVGDGSMDRPIPEPHRGSSSHGPQHAQQRAGQSGTVAQQPGTQGGGSWSLCGRCSKPIVPSGLGTALKPATEHWILCRKPLSESSIARNVLKHGTGGLNIDACRVNRASDDVPGWHKTGFYGRTGGYLGTDTFKIRDMPPEEVQERCGDKGRWPPNLLLSHSTDCRLVGTKKIKGITGTAAGRMRGALKGEGYEGFYTGSERAGEKTGYCDASGMEEVDAWECAPDCPVAEMDRQSGERPGCKSPSKAKCASIYRPDQGGYQPQGPIYGDTGGASRFFPTFRYQAKPSSSERNAGLDEHPDRTLNRVNPGGIENDPRWAPVQVKNSHPTLKGISLMKWLCSLITPVGGYILDPFLGSGSTGCAAVQLGYGFYGCDKDPEYVAMAEARIRYWESKAQATEE